MTVAVIWAPTRAAGLVGNGPGYPPVGGAPPPPTTPLKVWDGTQWQPAGVKVEE